MLKQFTVSMFNVGTVPSAEIRHNGSGVKFHRFNSETEALTFATANKNNYEIVIVKNARGDVIIKYHNGIET